MSYEFFVGSRKSDSEATPEKWTQKKRKTPSSKTVFFTLFGLFFKPNHSEQLFSTFHKFYKSEISVLKTTLLVKVTCKLRFFEDLSVENDMSK